MTTATVAQTTALRRAAVRASLAPSVHNTQPWRFRLRSGHLDIFADYNRQLTVLDPTSRQLVISCGCALMNARVALAGAGVSVDVHRFPDKARPELVATLAAGTTAQGFETTLTGLDVVLEDRQTNRRRFLDEDVPEDLLTVLEAAAAAEDAALFVVRDQEQRVAVATLSQHADAIENLNPAYRAELRAWTSADGSRRDGVPDAAVPHVDGGSQDEVPIRDFDTRGYGGLPTETHSSRSQCLILLCTSADGPRDWLRAGEALERVLLEVTRHGFAASPLTQVSEVPSARAQLRRQLGLLGYPHVLLRVGRAPGHAPHPPAPSRRRSRRGRRQHRRQGP